MKITRPYFSYSYGKKGGILQVPPSFTSTTFLWLWCLLLTTSLSAQYTLKGSITDAENGETLIGANVFLASDFSVGTQTDIDGTFRFSTTAHQGTLIVSYMGYEETAIVFQNTIAPLVIELTPKAMTIETVVVKGEKLTGQVFAVEKISKLDIYLNPAAQADALKAVQSNPLLRLLMKRPMLV